MSPTLTKATALIASVLVTEVAKVLIPALIVGIRAFADELERRART